MSRYDAVRRIQWAVKKKLIELDLSGLGLEELPPEIVKCRQLETLLLGRFSKKNTNELTNFPDAILQLTNLKILNLSHNPITSIPEAIGQLSNLTELTLLDTQITSIPEAIGQLSNLTRLDLSYNKITSIPDALGQLSNLTSLSLSSNQIACIPEAIGQLSNLTELCIRSNQIACIPEAIGQLSKLTRIILCYNHIAQISEAVGQLSNLTLLNIRDNQITFIPEAIAKLSNLKALILSNNQITEIPEVICSMKNLEELDLRDNPLSIPSQELDLRDSPPSIPSQELDLRDNPPSIPSQVLGYGQDYGGSGELQTISDSYSHSHNSVLHELDAERHKIESEGYFDAETLQDARRRITASLVQRQGQAEFRRKLLTAYGGRCPITDCDVESAIEAAHIIPYQGIQTNHLTNGLPLRADIHTLFDLHLLSIRPDTNEVVIAPELVGTCYQNLADRKLALPQNQKIAPNQNALSKHYETFLNRCKSSQLPAS